ncbi:STAS domain-containing protein [Paradevosia shaoguanensis]|uniref:STAS domain-containing protein n=1 Tax=Paradevosia shaoguanensis TaxID=1335043 RepID=A0AA41UIB4_9HYPH|nr:STAS domain-containing protein [Paradevosia shaoguanensis]KFL25816.1 hypothetical protein JP74_16805 [Devosia sp. 17-2-E-8]MCF1744693.1 STAS domain-containing protein [Paradevosia shaoguanensis]MCI0129176.1 STAS domain-containing protein [Paradevosia shaoguanensis]CDP53477.1 hypothetical protein [Devosia sp. DBB001]
MATINGKSVALPAIVDLDALDSVRDLLADAVEQGATTVSCAGVERISTNALFLLMSAAETARRQSTEFAVVEPSATMLAAVDRLGLGEQFAGLVKG